MSKLKTAIINILFGIDNLRSNLRLANFLNVYKTINESKSDQKLLVQSHMYLETNKPKVIGWKATRALLPPLERLLMAPPPSQELTPQPHSQVPGGRAGPSEAHIHGVRAML